MYAITIAASNLKVAVPDQFDALVRAFQMLDDQATRDLRAAPADQIMQQQGRSVLAFLLRQRLEGCMDKRREYEKR